MSAQQTQHSIVEAFPQRALRVHEVRIIYPCVACIASQPDHEPPRQAHIDAAHDTTLFVTKAAKHLAGSHAHSLLHQPAAHIPTLLQLLLGKGYEVHGIKRRTSLFNTDRIDHLYQDPHIDNRKFMLHYGDLTDATI